jgi:hypothetical protein
VTVVTLTSVKGAPGVTTTSCLVGATWPAGRAVFVAECDPAGGDLAARFALPAAGGWPTFELAARRAGSPVAVGPHLQRLPGGLEVLTRTRSETGQVAAGTPDLLLAGSRLDDTVGDVIIDLGRLVPAAMDAGGWSDRSDLVVVVLRGDSASVIQVRERSARFRTRWGDRVRLLVIGAGRRRTQEIEEFVGIPVVATLPNDPEAAAAVAGGQGRPRRLRRAPLIAAVTDLSQRLADPADPRSAGCGSSASPALPVPGGREAVGAGAEP